MMAMFYNTIISWAVYYLGMSFNGITGDLPWKRCGHTWNTNCCVPADPRLYAPRTRLVKLFNGTTIRAGVRKSALVKNCSSYFYSTEEYF